MEETIVEQYILPFRSIHHKILLDRTMAFQTHSLGKLRLMNDRILAAE